MQIAVVSPIRLGNLSTVQNHTHPYNDYTIQFLCRSYLQKSKWNIFIFIMIISINSWPTSGTHIHIMQMCGESCMTEQWDRPRLGLKFFDIAVRHWRHSHHHDFVMSIRPIYIYQQIQRSELKVASEGEAVSIVHVSNFWALRLREARTMMRNARPEAGAAGK